MIDWRKKNTYKFTKWSYFYGKGKPPLLRFVCKHRWPWSLDRTRLNVRFYSTLDGARYILYNISHLLRFSHYSCYIKVKIRFQYANLIIPKQIFDTTFMAKEKPFLVRFVCKQRWTWNLDHTRLNVRFYLTLDGAT